MTRFTLLIVLSALVLCGYMSTQDIHDSQNEYCEMVRLHMADHHKGWPDFHHSYKLDCTINLGGRHE